ncbi:DUF3472 domain-containing protein [Mucilaginibacter polytrichastri]|uniref:DUF5077 domain-containing protein n=1 Tax=Mucilaginibacter polytrichastri TaxID=1302689 RepID=A0A1Q5ZX07_9SPHI|nr:DUF3472 domain-containing protein [Mucilaginibacter polytrichastri]OKS86290.1 hypothetical protein RG47T_1742 [Mucilaginibacter polytrichastri]SFT16684.1 protein of unknown function [Mucilaginibacter polytrichastri]
MLKNLFNVVPKGSLLFIILITAAIKNFGAIIPADSAIVVPLGGNGWVNKNAQAKITEAGLANWRSDKDTISVYVRTEAAGTLNISLKLRVLGGISRISVTVGQTVLAQTVSNTNMAIVHFGGVAIVKPGYVQLKLQGINKSGEVYAEVSDVILSGTALSNGAAYVKDNHGNYYYWGHRGPSVHLNYELPNRAQNNIAYFYNEVTVLKGQDVMGSYFMTDGFTGGYFGMQVNSATERHILFSIWSPFSTDNPESIPDSLRIKLLKKGTGVHTGEFGSEGSGGQSYLNYPWVAGKTYAFLIKAQPDTVLKTTVFTAWFKEANQPKWLLIASFNRPKSGFYLNKLYSFLENFDESMGAVTRKVFFGNQWVIGNSGKWYPINNALFTGDATAIINYRKDYGGGTQGNLFYLRNCGFFNDFTMLKTKLVRPLSGNAHPEIDIQKLP